MSRRRRRGAAESPRTAVIYARVSSREQEREGFSIPAQLKLLRGYAESKGLQILREFQEAETAKRAGRTQFEALIEFLGKTPTCRTVLVQDTDRLYRNWRDYVTLDDLKLELHFVREHKVISPDSNSNDKLMHDIQVAMARSYVNKLSEKVSWGLTEKAEQGMWPGSAPVGYRMVERGGKKVIEPDPASGPLVRRLFEKYAEGDISITDLRDWVRSMGLRSRRGRVLSRSQVHNLLRCRTYCGSFDWAGKTYRGSYTPLISVELWDRVQTELAARGQGQHTKARKEFAFSGLIRCGHCGCALVGEVKKQRYTYYHCSRSRQRCPEPYTREEVLEEKFGLLLKSLRFDPDVLTWLKDGLRASRVEEQRFRDESVARLRAEHDRLQRRLDAMYDDRLDGRITADYFDRRSGEMRLEQDRLAAEIEAHAAADRAYVDEGVQLLELVQSAHELYLRQPPAEKRTLLRFVVSNSTWKDGELTVALKQPFDVLRDAARTTAGTKSDPGASGSPGVFELAHKDSNLDWRIQSPLSYH